MIVTLKLSEDTIQKMNEFYKETKRKTPPYAVFSAMSEDTVITAYQSGKVVFQGISADIDSNLWKEMELKNHPNSNIDTKKKEKKKVHEEYISPKIINSNLIGSDEVGTGDYFGPIVVTASYVRHEDHEFLTELGVKDSKKIDDHKIKEIVPKIIKKIPYKTIKLNNSDYNKQIELGYNMNKIKAIMHNKVLLEMNNLYAADYTIIDEFCKPYLYFNYLKESNNVYRKIIFKEKAEDKFLAVAVSSLISRYVFLEEIDKLSKELNITLPLGASSKVDLVAKEIVEKYGFEKLAIISKIHFANTKKIGL